jgi:hypothetical protein
MTWSTFHHRGATLQRVLETADARRDGLLPLDLPGVAETFHGELDLIAALWLKWNARLSGNIERALVAQPLDLEGAVASAWSLTSEQLPGLRAILDRYVESPSDSEMAAALGRAKEKEWARLAAAAGLANDESPAAARAGRQVELRARTESAEQRARQSAEDLLAHATTDVRTSTDLDGATPSLVERIKAVLAA